MHIARRGGIQQNRPGNIAVFPFFYLVLSCAALKTRIKKEILEKCLAHTGIQFIQPQNQLVPVVFLLNNFPDSTPLGLIPAIRRKAIYQCHQFGNVLLRIAFNIAQGLIDRKILHAIFNCTHKYVPFFCFFRMKPPLADPLAKL